MEFHTKPSTWLAVMSLLLTAFTAQPNLASLTVHAANVLVLAALIWQAHHEGRISKGGN